MQAALDCWDERCAERSGDIAKILYLHLQVAVSRAFAGSKKGFFDTNMETCVSCSEGCIQGVQLYPYFDQLETREKDRTRILCALATTTPVEYTYSISAVL